MKDKEPIVRIIKVEDKDFIVQITWPEPPGPIKYAVLHIGCFIAALSHIFFCLLVAAAIATGTALIAYLVFSWVFSL